LILAGNYKGTKAYHYDEFAPTPSNTDKLKSFLGINNLGYPRILEFELSNTCNLECTMCSGHFSSSIRKNREHLPALQSPYDADFVNQLTEFMPHLTDMKFLGGEPFLIDIYYDIWERIIEVNPKIKVHITTNGTILNNRGKRILEKLNVAIILSVDSLDKDTYEGIRLNAKYDRMMENLEFFKKLTREKKTYLTFAVCPIATNWKTMPHMLQVANAEGINLHFNIVWAPEYLSLQYLDMDSLREVINLFESGLPATTSNPTATNNVAVYKEYIGTLKYWLQEKEENPEADLELFKQVVLDADLIQAILPTTEDAQLLTITIICWYAEMNHSGEGKHLAKQLPHSDKLLALLGAPNLPEAITQLRLQSAPHRHIMNFMEALKVLDKLMGTSDDGVLERRIAMVMPILDKTSKQDQAAYDLGANGAFLQLRFLKQQSEELVFEKYASLFEQVV
jgi:sulfatase maturation enzyme AslB (radical SAM superfamily)